MVCRGKFFNFRRVLSVEKTYKSQQSKFYRQIRNFVIDIRGTTTESMAAIHWQVGQATPVTNVSIAAINGQNNAQMDFFTENGSGGFMSDVTIVGGAYGICKCDRDVPKRGTDWCYQTEEISSTLCAISS